MIRSILQYAASLFLPVQERQEELDPHALSDADLSFWDDPEFGWRLADPARLAREYEGR